LDTLTHIVTGACIGELIAGKTIGKKAMLLGAAAQLIPDIDAVSHLWLDDVRGLLAHRGITHSILFAALVTIAMGLLVHRTFKRSGISLTASFLLCGVNIFTHLLVDSFNAYGTSLLEPFSDRRISFHTIFVIDPFFSFWPFLAFLFLLRLKSGHPARKLWAGAGVVLSATYLLYAGINKLMVEKTIQVSMQNMNIATNEYFVTPAPLNSWLWFIAIKQNNGYYTAYRSVFDHKKDIRFSFGPRNDSLLSTSGDKKEVELLKKFSQGFYTVEKRDDSLLVFNVLRFGQVTGWHGEKQKFAFYYYLDKTGNNDLAVQRGRFENWNRETFLSLIRRIWGN
jgi:inner membrane protein